MRCARVSTGLQNLDLQEDSLKKFGCEKVFTDHMSGSTSNRPGLETAIESVRSGDTLVVWQLDRLGINMEDLITVVNRLNNRGVSFHHLQKNITMDKSNSTGQLMFHLFAEFERHLILERSASGRARGRFGGRPEKLSKSDIQHQKMKKLLDDTYPIGEILKVDTRAIPTELETGIKNVQDKLEEFREAVRNVEVIPKETDTF